MSLQADSQSKDRSAVSRFLKGRRRDAQDEIDAWIADTTSEFGRGTSSRVSAQPPKNVTEQKMLEAKLFEMSKQRYNFILHSRWQQKLFMEKQRQKTAVMKDLLRNVDLSRLQNSSISRKSIRLPPPSFRTDHSSRIPLSDLTKPAEERTLSPATIETDMQKKTVTFVTERPSIAADVSHDSSMPISAVQSANLPEFDLSPLEESGKDVPDIFSSHRGRKAYILPLEGRWPVKDVRFVKLSQALSENYTGTRRREAPIANLA